MSLYSLLYVQGSNKERLWQVEENSNNKGIIIIGKDLENEEIEVQCLKDNKIPHYL